MTMLSNLKIISIPNEPWLHRLRVGHYIWLVKEKEYAQVEWSWDPPEPGHRIGILGIGRITSSGDNMRFNGIQKWYVGSKGEGIDGSQLMAPLQDNLTENPPPSSIRLPGSPFRYLEIE